MEQIIYTDGACTTNPNGVGAWAYVILDESKKKRKVTRSGREFGTTSNRMELQAILKAVQDYPNAVLILSDSLYSVNCVNGVWRAKANLDLILPIRKALGKRDVLRWIRGHSGELGNELADETCNDEMREAYLERYGIEFGGLQ